MPPSRTLPTIHWRCLFVTTALAMVFATAAEAQDVGPDKPVTLFNQGMFRFAAQARSGLHQLWGTSTAAREERVACIGGYVQEGVVYITHIEQIESSRADSANISAVASLRDCGPPSWFGTVHTHIATFNGQPYTTFSAPDRYVMMLWNNQWKMDGVFCILYSESEATCESGYALSAQAAYGYERGNNILF